MLRDKQVERIIICRPVVGVGKDIGFLPGTMEEKVGPYLTPMFDELSYYIDTKFVNVLIGERIIEIVPLSMMRGRTFSNCFVMLDEAQNATRTELKMLLTRIGQGSRMILSGDLGQTDLPTDIRGAFSYVIERLQGLNGVGIIGLTSSDIVRHSLIAEIEKRISS